jgi:hypothetical protein
MDGNSMDLSVIVVVGDCRERAERMFEAISGQSAADRVEIVVVDAASGSTKNLRLPAGLSVRYVRVDAGILPGSARYAGIAHATAPVIAFLEDHCFPDKDWAAAILEAHQEGWDAVGYSFVNGSPDAYLYRSVFLGEYGPWAKPHAGGATLRLPGSNVSFKRQALLRFGNRLGELFEMEYLLHESLRHRGSRFCIEPRAVVFHECYADFVELLYCHFLFSRLQAARRTILHSWSCCHRLAMGIVVPIVLPGLQLYRAWRVLRTHRLFGSWLRAIPVIYLIHQCEAIGESIGLLAGSGNSRRRFARSELNSARINR